MISVLLADDQALVRAGFRALLNAEPDIDVVAEAADGIEAVRLTRQTRPDVVLMDIRMPGVDGLEATRRIVADTTLAGTKVVILTTFDLDEYVYGALKAGASGFLLKDAGTDMLSQAVHAAARGDALIAPSVTARLLSSFASRRSRSVPAEPVEALTAREEQVLLAAARGRTNGEIGEELSISLSTVKTHIAALMRKLDARNRVEIVMWAYETGRVDT